jgi:hypothetical protein
MAGIGLLLGGQVSIAWKRIHKIIFIWGLNVNLLPELGHSQVDLIWALTQGWLS